MDAVEVCVDVSYHAATLAAKRLESSRRDPHARYKNMSHHR